MSYMVVSNVGSSLAAKFLSSVFLDFVVQF